MPPAPSSRPRTGPNVPNQHSAAAAPGTSPSDPAPPASLGKSEKETAWPPPAGPLAGDTRSIARAGVSHTDADDGGAGPAASYPIGPPRVAPTATATATTAPAGWFTTFSAPGASTTASAEETTTPSAEETIAPSSPPKVKPTARCMSTPCSDSTPPPPASTAEGDDAYVLGDCERVS